MSEAGIPTAPCRYGNRRVPKMYAQINALRRAIAAEGTPNIQDAWAKVEEHIDFAYQAAAGAKEGVITQPSRLPHQRRD